MTPQTEAGRHRPGQSTRHLQDLQSTVPGTELTESKPYSLKVMTLYMKLCMIWFVLMDQV